MNSECYSFDILHEYSLWSDLSVGSIIFDLVILTLEFDPFFENFNLANNFWTVISRALIFHMNIPCDKTFPLKPLFLTMWPWPRCLTYSLKTLILLKTFEPWVLELWYIIWVFLVTRTFRGCYYFLPCDLDLGIWPVF